MFSPLLHEAMVSPEPPHKINQNRFPHRCCIQQLRAKSFFVKYTQNCVLLLQQWPNGRFFMIYTKNHFLANVAQSYGEQRTSLHYVPKIVSLPLLHTALVHAAEDLIFDIYQTSCSCHWCIKQ